jgi:beta-glucanase (GH16 family)
MLISRVHPRYLSYGKHDISNSILSLIVEPNSTVKSGVGDLASASIPQAVSCVQSIEKNILHLTSPANHDVNPFYGFIAQEGYYEIKCRCPKGSGVHSAFWLVGLQDKIEQRYEVDIVEYHGQWATKFPHGSHNNGSETDVTENYPSNYVEIPNNLNDEFHTIGFLWESNKMTWFFDGELLDELEATMPQYPMGMILSLHQRKYGTSWTGQADNTLGTLKFEIDYIKVYKEASYKLSKLSITGQDSISVKATSSYKIDDDLGILTDMPSYCRINWNDGSKTEHHVKWEIFNNTIKENLDNGTPFTWYGYVDELDLTVSASITF